MYLIAMDMRQITASYTVCPQISPLDIPAIVEAGFTTIINNRPDIEIPVEVQSATMRIAAEAAGLTFIDLPLTHDTMHSENIARQMQIVAEASGPVFAYCATGTRCTVIWCLGQAGKMEPCDIIETAAQAGYDMSLLEPRLAQG